jgi:NarL family two-component system response regulator LiaR
MMTRPIRILLVDDHAVVRQGLRMFLDLDPELEIVGEAGNGLEALARIEELSPQVVLMDLMMPEMGGIEAIRQCRLRFPDVEVIALTSVLEDKSVVQAVKEGATGYLLKNTEADELRGAIKAAAEGKIQLSPEASKRLVKSFQAPDPLEQLSDRELKILKLLAQGASNKEIAEPLAVAEKTVKANVTSILTKLGLKSRTQAAIHAWKTGLVSNPGAFEAT